MTDYQEFEPLRRIVYAAFETFADDLGTNKTGLYTYFVPKTFSQNLANWLNGDKWSLDTNIKFTIALITIFDGAAEATQVTDEALYKKFVAATQKRAPDTADLLTQLRDCLGTLRARVAKGSSTAFSEAIALQRQEPLSAADAHGRSQSSHFKELYEFPGHIRDVAALVRSASESVLIHADAVDYGSFRDFEAHRALLQAIIDRKKKREVRRLFDMD